MKAKLFACAMAATTVASALCTITPVMAADQTVDSGEGTVPVNLTVEPTAINVSVPQTIDGSTAADSNTVLFGSDYKITNNAKTGAIIIDSLKTESAGGWTLDAKATDYANMAKDSKHIYIGAKLGTDSAFSDMKDTYSPTDSEIASSGASKDLAFEGLTNAVSAKVNAENVANLIVTLHQK